MLLDLTPDLEPACRRFLEHSPSATYAQDPAWIEVIREAYGKEAGMVLSVKDDSGGARTVNGLAPFATLASPLSRQLVCLPYLDYGGPVGEDSATVEALCKELRERALRRGVACEIRSLHPLPGLAAPVNEKVAMLLPIADTDVDAYWKKLDAKVRNQVRKAEKSAVTVQWGREERLEDFYRVFCVNMRDLGSPVHGRAIFESVLRRFPGASVGTAHREGRCIGGLFRILWRDTLAIPWASTLREARQYCPNNALYWESIRFAFASGCARIDFGRSSKDEGTYKFKKQWLSEEAPLFWYPFDGQGAPLSEVAHAASGKLKSAQQIWTRLPLGLANFLGPRIRGHISA